MSTSPNTEARAFSLLELVLAFGIVALLFLTLGLLFLSLLRGSAKASNTTVGVVFAEDVLDSVIRNDLYSASAGPRSQGIYTVDEANQTNFFYTVDSTQVPAVAGVHAGGYLVTVEVWWWTGDAQQARAGQGRLSTRVTRLHLPGSLP
ncbi:MAG: hypothetical protein KC910_21365 [Candidatus Eremiobacteraeota bacterium]|nr:hypothetical protein [Candidatus Eremiobacteraeota bacterium]